MKMFKWIKLLLALGFIFTPFSAIQAQDRKMR